jgi:hypothetical protein
VSREENDQMTHMDEPRVVSTDPATASAVLPDAFDSGRVYGTPECWPLPWRCERDHDSEVDYLVPANAEPNTVGGWWPNHPIFDDGLEAFIAHRVNCHDELVAACKLAEFAFRVPAGTRVDLEIAALHALRMVVAKAESGQ